MPVKRASSRPIVRRAPRRSSFSNRSGAMRRSALRIEILGHAGQPVEPGHDGIPVGGGQVGALRQRPGVVAEGVGADVLQERRQIGRLRRQPVVVPRRGGHRRQVQLVRQVARERWSVEVVVRVQVRRDQDGAVECHALAAERREEHGRACRAIGLAQQELRGVPPVRGADVARDELRERGDVLIAAVEVLRLALAGNAREAGAHGVHEHQVGPVEQAVLVVHDRVGRRRRGLRIRGVDPLRAERAHVQPERGRSGAAVEDERHRSGGRVADALPRVGHVEHAARQVAFVVQKVDGGRRGRVRHRGAANRDAAVRHRRGNGRRLRLLA